MISIITPVYKSAGCIRRYLDIVMSQTFQDIEVLIVDDHGEDGTIGIAHEVTDSYDGPIRFRYLATPANSGPGAARNLGIDSAEGKYIAFVDSDDELDPKFCELLVSSAEQNGSDLCCCNLDIYDEDGNFCGTRRCPEIEDGEFTGEMRKSFLHTYVSYFTTYLYRKSLFDEYHIHFPSNRSSEDSAMLCCALLCCRRISHVDKSLYRYMRMTGSLTTSSDNSRYRQKLASLGSLMDIVREKGWYEADKEEIDFIYFKKAYMMSVFDYIGTSRKASRTVLEEIRKELLRQIPDYRSNSYYKGSLSFMILDKLITGMPSLAVPVIRLYMKRFNRSII